MKPPADAAPEAGVSVPTPRPAPEADSLPGAAGDAAALTDAGSDVDLLPDAVPPSPARDELTERDREILAFERRWWRHAGAKEQAIRDTFQLSATRYYQLLNALLDRPAALAAEPMLVGRLRRLRSSRTRSRRR